jgi:hypothetical protein
MNDQPQREVKLTLLPDGFFKIHEGSTVKLENGRFIRLNIPAFCVKIVLETVAPSEFLPAIQQPDLQQPDLQQSAIQPPDLQQSAIQQPAIQQPDLQPPAIQQSVIQPPDLQQPDLQQSAIQPPDLQQSAIQPPDLQSDYDSILSQNLNFDYDQQISSWDNLFDNSDSEFVSN